MKRASNGTAPSNGLVSGALTAVGQDVTFSDQTYPAATTSAIFVVALSTTANVYTAPASGNTMRCDIKYKASN
jgi:hypothetical protein